MMPHVRLLLTRPEEWRAAYFEHAPAGGVFVPARKELTIGTRVDVEIDVLTDIFHLEGKVVWRRLQRGRGLREGVGVAFLPNEKGALARLLAHFEHRYTPPRESRRVPLELKIHYNTFFSLARDAATDLSEGGMRVQSSAPPPVGHPVVLVVWPPRSFRPLRLTGQVVWRSQDEYGVRFTGSAARERARLEALVLRARVDA
jgi:Tfp pilus assembly protein PilZ